LKRHLHRTFGLIDDPVSGVAAASPLELDRLLVEVIRDLLDDVSRHLTPNPMSDQ
jgi:hypothetical protein